MELIDVHRGMNVRYENQKWKGTVLGINDNYNEVQVHFEGENSNEYIPVEFLRLSEGLKFHLSELY